MSELKLFTSRSGTSPRRLRMFLAEKDIEIPAEIIDLAGRQQRSDQFRAINPLGAVPVLRLEDGSYLSESHAIARYVEELHPEPNLFGLDAVERAKIEMWNRRIELDVASLVSMAIKHTNPFFEGTMTQVPAYAEACKVDIIKKYEWLDSELRTRDFIAGDRFTVADITAFARLSPAASVGMQFADHFEYLSSWWSRIEARPSAGA